MADGTDWTTVLVAMVTGLTAVGGNAWLARSSANREGRSVRAALLAEVAALIDVLERRGFLKNLRRAHQFLENLEDWQLEALDKDEWKMPVPISDYYNRVYQENVTRLGSLSAAEAGQIVRFYQLCDAVKADVTEGGVLHKGSIEFEAYREAADMLEIAMDVGRTLIKPKSSIWK